MTPPPAGTVEAWLYDYVLSESAMRKLTPPPVLEVWEEAPPVRRLEAPGRPPEWSVVARAPASVKRGALGLPAKRAQLFHTFLHHELQAAELMAWALLAFPATPPAFRKGLLAILLEELEHLALYRGYLRTLGIEFGDLEVRDWFWSRVPRVQTPQEFVAVMGVGFEGGNLDHTERYLGWFREIEEGAAIEVLEVVRDEEIRHVRFAAHWFREFTGGLDFEAWRLSLPEPLTPTVMKGRPLNHEHRRAAGFSPEFLALLEAW